MDPVTAMNALNNIHKDDERHPFNGTASSGMRVYDGSVENASLEREEVEDLWNISLIGPELRTIRQEEVFLLLHILPPSVLALIERANVTDTFAETGSAVGQ